MLKTWRQKVTRLTCQGDIPRTKSYPQRVAERAVRVSVEGER